MYDTRTAKIENYLKAETTEYYNLQQEHEKEKIKSPKLKICPKSKLVINYKERAQIKYKQKPRKYTKQRKKKNTSK